MQVFVTITSLALILQAFPIEKLKDLSTASRHLAESVRKADGLTV